MRGLALSVAVAAALVCSSAHAVNLTYSGTIGPSTYNRVIAPTTQCTTPTSLSSQTTVRYHTKTFHVSVTGTYTLDNVSNTFTGGTANDSFMALYLGSFNAAAPLTNVVYANDNGPNPPRARISCTLNACTTYVLVTSGFQNGHTGDFTNTLSGVGDVLDGAASGSITVSPTSVPEGTKNVAYAATQFTASGGSSPYTWSITGTLPTGMTFNTSTATLSGTPTQGGMFPLTIRATDAGGCFADRTVQLLIRDVSLPCITDRLAAGDQTFNRPVVTDSASSGIAGGGCTLSPNGTATFYRAYEFVVSGSGCTLTATLCSASGCNPITGSGALANPLLLLYRVGGLTAGTGTTGAFNAGNPCNNLVAANDQLGTASSGGLAACAANSNLPGLQRTIGPGRFMLVVTSANNGETGAYSLSVGLSGGGCNLSLATACPTITVTPASIPNVESGSAYPTQTFAASGGTGPYTFSITGTLPTGLTFTPGSNTASLSGTPTQSGSFPITVTAVDANGCAGSKIYNLVITDRVLPCILDALTSSDPTYNRATVDDTTASGIPASCSNSPNATAVTYKAYEFEISGCASANVIASLCGSCGSVGGTGALTNPVIAIYRTGGLSGAGGAAGAFNPASACTNLVAQNDNLNGSTSSGGLAACAANNSLAGVQRTLAAGRFMVVVTSAANAQTGAYQLSLATSGGGCKVCPITTMSPAAGSLADPTKGSPYNQSFSVGFPAAAPVTFAVTSGTLPSGLSLSTSGALSGTPTQAGPFSFTITGTDATGCTTSAAYSLRVVTSAANYLASFGLTGPDAALTLDYEFDGLANLLEYALSLDPKHYDPTGSPVVILKDYADTKYLSITFTRSSVASDITYIVQGTADLVNWDTLATSAAGGAMSGPGFVGESPSGTSYNVEVRDIVPFDPVAHPRRFLRLKVTAP